MKENIKKITKEIKENFEDLLGSSNDENVRELRKHIREEILKEIGEYQDELISIVESEGKLIREIRDIFYEKYINMPDDIRYLFKIHCILGPVLLECDDVVFAEEFYRGYTLSLMWDEQESE